MMPGGNDRERHTHSCRVGRTCFSSAGLDSSWSSDSLASSRKALKAELSGASSVTGACGLSSAPWMKAACRSDRRQCCRHVLRRAVVEKPVVQAGPTNSW
jgi:hypothetical protein